VKGTLTQRQFIWLAGVAGIALVGITYVLWRRRDPVSGSIAEVAHDVSPGPYRIGALIVEIDFDWSTAPSPEWRRSGPS
jgi:hypothetical protein